MSSTENRQSSSSDGLQIPGLVRSQDSVEQLSFGKSSSTTPFPATAVLTPDPQNTPDLSDRETMRQVVALPDLTNPPTPTPEPGSTRALLLQSQPAITRALTTTLSNGTTTSLRPPVVIRGESKKVPLRPPQGRRHVIGIAAILLLLLITVGTLFAVSPMSRDAGMHLNPFAGSNGNLVDGGGSGNLKLVTQQATATAIVHQQNDGFDPNSGGGSPALSAGAGSENWPVGVCTYWANLDYHNLTGFWVTWTGDAYQWADGASLAGWVVSSTPKVYSIIVLQPGVQGASGFGHVAVVTGISGNVVHTSNMNWYANGGGWDVVSEMDFTVGPGVSFAWHP